MKRICVYCGSSEGRLPAYRQAADELGRSMAARGIGLVYGGASIGLMGQVADSVLAGGAEAIGIIPRSMMEKEIAHAGLNELKVVGSMHERKALMAELSDGFIALPGGLGTFEELFEALTWAQLRYHDKPCGILNTAGYYDGLLTFIDKAFTDGFIKPRFRDLLRVAREPAELLDLMNVND